ncbi:hypothetical protein B296_00023702 [Ensete ventricosum]|uniref:Uncharacterized protein n=1 Tax=Ensete ventricosum TaxID=4639 RepID=A0A426YW52_ENSVE|nr:hypothetical protein B296_00023702 [Ensete ventricosum]
MVGCWKTLRVGTANLPTGIERLAVRGKPLLRALDLATSPFSFTPPRATSRHETAGLPVECCRKKYPKLQQKSTSPLLDRASVLNRNRTRQNHRGGDTNPTAHESLSVLLDAHSLSEQAPVAETVGKPIASPYRGVHILGLFRSTPERKLVIFYRLQIVERRASPLHLLLLYYFR